MILVRRIYFQVVLGALALAVVLWGIAILALDWRAGHTSLYLINPKIDWIGYYVDHAWEKATHYIAADERVGLPPVRLYIPRRSQEALVENLPDSAKKWQPGYLLYPDDIIREVKVRHRGDNPYNWMFEKKSWRVKVKKKALIGGTRVFNYVVPQVGQVSEHIGLSIAKRAGNLAPNSRLVELFVNDDSMGIYFEAEHLNEEFLRNNGLMPVNLYKGEQYYQERVFRVDHDMFNNPSLWRKTSINNKFGSGDTTDLASVFELLRTAETSADDMVKLKRLAPYAEWARYAALQTLIQSPHNDAVHNMRAVFDSWRGQFIPIAYDLGIEAAQTVPVSFDFAPHGLLRLYHRHSDFLLEKYRLLYRLLVEDEILIEAARELKELEPGLAISMGRDKNLAQGFHFWGYAKEWATPNGARARRRALIQRLNWLHEDLRTKIAAVPESKWQATKNGVALNVSGLAPVSDIVLKLVPARLRPSKFAWDANRNGRLDDNDYLLPVEHSDEAVKIKATWLSNRALHSSERNRTYAFFMQLSAQSARFELVGDVAFQVQAMKISNALTGEQTEVISGDADGAVPGRWNLPVLPTKAPETEIWRGMVRITGHRVIVAPVRIMAGTTIDMGPEASLVFRGTLEVDGTASDPVRVKRAHADSSWGVFALQGNGTAGSHLAHMHISGGSGALVEAITYTGMLSIHDTSNILLDGVIGEDNAKVDDMIHVVYANGVVFRNCEFLRALSDAVDIDISTVQIEGGRIVDAGNDAIDLMTTRAMISSIDLEGSGDKGISVGEDSRASIWNIRLRKNAIGIEVKDGSKVGVVHSDFIANATQINAYKKNWRYGTGGDIEVWKSYFSGARNRLTAKKKSNISIKDSTISPLPKKKKRVSLAPDVDSTGKRRARTDAYGEERRHLPTVADLSRFEGVRGAIR